VTVVGVKRQKADFADAKPDTVVNRGEGLIVAGSTKLVEALAALM
jgi:trk system potassium uptake protein TrkA